MSFYKNKNVLVTGGCGFVGANLIKSLLKQQANITATYHVKKPVVNDDNVRYIQVDLLDKNDCKRIVKDIDLVFMCAANTSGAAVIDTTPLVHLTPNIIMNLQMLEAAYTAGIKKYLFISSNVVYPVSDIPVAENQVNNEFFEKYHIAAWMKRFSEIVCDMYSTKIAEPMKTIVVRPGNLYGEYDNFDWQTSHVIPALIRKVVERHSPIEVWGDGSDLKDFIYIGDFIQGLLLAMEKIDKYDPINIASGTSHTIREILDYIIDIDGYQDAEIVFDRSKPRMIPTRLINTEKAKLELGFVAGTALKEGLQKTIHWFRESNLT